VKTGEMLSEINGFSIVTQQILVELHLCDQVVKELPELQNQQSAHVTI
jgi:hypothetical protein